MPASRLREQHATYTLFNFHLPLAVWQRHAIEHDGADLTTQVAPDLLFIALEFQHVDNDIVRHFVSEPLLISLLYAFAN